MLLRDHWGRVDRNSFNGINVNIKESGIKSVIVVGLRANGYVVIPLFTGGIPCRVAGGKIIMRPNPAAGIADLIILLNDGRYAFVEVKRPKGGRQQENQKRFQKMVESVNGIYILARSLRDVLERLKEEGY